MTVRAPLAVAASLLAGAAGGAQAASAAEVKVDGAAIVFSAAPGERNGVAVGGGGVPADSFAIADGANAVTARAPCRQQSDFDTTIVCPTAGIARVQILLGDGDDTVEEYSGGNNTAKLLPMSVSGGEGDDQLTFDRPVAIAFDGGAGDDIAAGGPAADVLLGGAGRDDLNGGPGGDVLDGGGGPDELTGGDGDDRLAPGRGDDFASANAGDDTIDWRNGEKDVAGTGCSTGRDTILQDPGDEIVEYDDDRDGVTTVDPTCERVRGQRAPAPSAVFERYTPKPRALKLGLDIRSAFGGTFEIEVVLPPRQARAVGLGDQAVTIATGTTRHHATRTIAVLRMTRRAAKAVRGKSVTAIARVRNSDTGGRTGSSTHRVSVTKL